MPPKNQRWWLTTDHVDLVVNASPEQIYDLVADMPRMGEWSDECTTVEWEQGATGPVAGARFVGHNHTGPRGIIRWSRHGRVLVADRGKEFAFVTEEGGHESTGATRLRRSTAVRASPSRMKRTSFRCGRASSTCRRTGTARS